MHVGEAAFLVGALVVADLAEQVGQAPVLAVLRGVATRVGLGLQLGVWYWLGVATVAVLLSVEHALVSPRDLRRLNAAFFTMNGVISVVFFVFVLAEVVA